MTSPAGVFEPEIADMVVVEKSAEEADAKTSLLEGPASIIEPGGKSIGVSLSLWVY